MSFKDPSSCVLMSCNTQGLFSQLALIPFSALRGVFWYRPRLVGKDNIVEVVLFIP